MRGAIYILDPVGSGTFMPYVRVGYCSYRGSWYVLEGLTNR